VNQLLRFAWTFGLAGLAGCDVTPSAGPAACLPIDGSVFIQLDGGTEGSADAGAEGSLDDGSGLDAGDSGPEDIVWGFADLHAHVAIERAFGGRLVWGSAVDDAPVNATELPLIATCPVETHDHNAATPIDRAVGALLFPEVAKVAEFAHAPVGALGSLPSDAWPNARDIIHQQMNVASIRRAYEAGLRLMFASTTDDQIIAQLLAGPNFVNALVPDPRADYASARRQLDWIEQIVAQNSNWMSIAQKPAEARHAIQTGHLALVLSVEMEGLLEEDLNSLVRDYGVAHVIPVHLVDNDIGGTAANGDLFNTASAAVSAIYRSDQQPMRYMDVAPSTAYGRKLSWPVEIVTGPQSSAPLYANISPIPFASYAAYGYEPQFACCGTAPNLIPFVEQGQRNERGLCDSVEDQDAGACQGPDRVRRMLQRQLIVDVSHMSYRAVGDTMSVAADAGLAPQAATVPLIASHGDIAHLCRDADAGCDTDLPVAETTERALDVDQARAIVDAGGILGLGTPTGSYRHRAVLSARGGPLLTLDPSTGRAAGCVVVPSGDGGADAAGCEPAVSPFPPLTAPVDTLQIETVGGISDETLNARPFVRIELDGPDPQAYERRVIVAPLECSTQACAANVPLAPSAAAAVPYAASCPAVPSSSDASSVGATVGDIASVTLEWLYLQCDEGCEEAAGRSSVDPQCQSTWDDDRAPHWTIDEALLFGFAQDAGAPIALAQLGPRSVPPAVVLARKRGQALLYQRDDNPLASAIPASGQLLRVSVLSGVEQDLPGATTSRVGSNVCVAVRQSVDGACQPAPPPPPGATECPTSQGWAKANQRGAWPAGTLLYTFVRIPVDSDSVCGVDVAVLDWDSSSAPWTIDQITVEAIEDPVGHWIRRYADVSRLVADGRLGTVAFGTDFNGLNGLTDISEFPVEAGAQNPSACPVAGDPLLVEAGLAAPLALAPMRLRNADGTLGEEVRIEERGLATYGLLADFVSIVKAYPGCGPDVYDSLMLSAEATLRLWEAVTNQVPDGGRSPLPQKPFACGAIPGVSP
jgi:microsomal dipeptidase-like Zn-dependent dipeptidase